MTYPERQHIIKAIELIQIRREEVLKRGGFHTERERKLTELARTLVRTIDEMNRLHLQGAWE